RTANIVEIARTADGTVIDKLTGPRDRAYEGGVAISADGRRAWVSETHDAVIAFAIDPHTGRAQETGTVKIPVDPNAAPPDDFPPRTGGPQGYPSGLALTAD